MRIEGDGWNGIRVISPKCLPHRYLGSCEAISARSGDGELMAGQTGKREKDERLCMFIFQTKHLISMPCSQ